MKRFLLVLYSVCASVVVCAMTESEFNEWQSDVLDYLDETDSYLVSANSSVYGAFTEVEGVRSDIENRISTLGNDTSPSFSDYDVKQMLVGYLSSLPNSTLYNNAMRDVASARSLVSSAYGMVASVYYGSDLSDITNILERIRYYTQSIDYKVGLISNLLESVNNILTYVQHIDSVIVPASGNNPGYIRTQTTLDLNLDFPLQHYLDGFYHNLSSIWTNTTELSRQLNQDIYPRLYSTQSPNIYDVQHNFLEWYQDTKFASSNSYSWKPWFNPNMFIDGCFFLGEYLDPVIQQLGLTPNSDGGFDLSNEGKLLLYMFGQNERKFLCDLNTAEMVNYLASRTNDLPTVDLSAITNYLYLTQKPFYDNFNTLLNKFNVFQADPQGYYSNRNLPSGKSPINLITNLFFKTASIKTPVELSQAGSAFTQFQNSYTNIFQRYEILLMNLNGMFPSDSDLDDLGEMLTTEGASESMFDQATNKYGEAVAAFTSTSNTLQSVKSCFENIVSAFDFRESSGSTVDDTAYFSVVHDWCGDFEMPQISLSFQETGLQSVCEYGHRFFRVIWYLLATVGFSILFFKLAVTGSKAVMRALILISTLLGK